MKWFVNGPKSSLLRADALFSFAMKSQLKGLKNYSKEKEKLYENIIN